jgi:hypothetical protein
MKLRTVPLLLRYTYDPDLVPLHGTPLYDTKQARPVPPTNTIRIGAQYLTPKQVVYALHHPGAQPTPTNPDPCITLPRFILNLDRNPRNILIENLEGAEASRRWEHRQVRADNGTIVPVNLFSTMTEDDFARLGLTFNNLRRTTQSDNKT